MSKFTIYIAFVLFLINCKGIKNIHQDDFLYTGAKLKVDSKKPEKFSEQKESLSELIKPSPNANFLGSRPFLWLHNRIKEPDKQKGFKYFLKYKIGKPPVLLSKTRPEKTSQQLSNWLYNNGYFRNTINYSINKKSKTASIIYEINPGRRYTISKVSYPKDKIDISYLESIRKNSLLKEAQPYSLENIEQERFRIETVLKDSGFYYFDHSFIEFLADSTIGNNQIELIATLSKNTPTAALLKYKIKEVSVQTTSGLLNRNDSLNNSTKRNMVEINGVEYYDAENKYKPKAILRYLDVEEGQTYQKVDYQQTVSKLLSLQNFTYVDINYPEDEEKGYLNARLNLITKPTKSIRFEIQATSESNNFVGSSVTTTFLNRNIFRGAEIFNLSLNTGFETQISSQQQNALNSYEISLRTSVKIPRLISPVGINNTNKEFVPNTTIGMGYEIIRRTNLYAFNSAELNLGYKWSVSKIKSHQLSPVYIKLTQLTNTSAEFDEILDNNPLLRESYEEQFVFGSRYSYFINTLADEVSSNKRHNFYFDFSIEVSGNLLYLLNGGFASQDNKTFKIFGSRYSQFFRTSLDIRHYLRFNKHHKLASRMILGIGSAYGNSNTLPVSRQFAIGGSSSIRAFRARSIGPGSFSDEQTSVNNVQIDQTADLKIETNLEYRHTLAGALQGAVFLDAGNIWTLRTDPERPGSQFSSNRFFEDFAIGTGYGLRYDASFFILRLDLAFPLRIPSASGGWVISNIAIDKKQWRRDNLVWNVALGFPF